MAHPQSIRPKAKNCISIKRIFREKLWDRTLEDGARARGTSTLESSFVALFQYQEIDTMTQLIYNDALGHDFRLAEICEVR